VSALLAALPYAGATAGVLSFFIVVRGLGLALYRRTLGSRRDLTKRLNRIDLGVTLEYLATFFGPPKYATTSKNSGWAINLYEEKHATLSIVLNEELAVGAYSIAIQDRRFRFDVNPLTKQQFKVQLGRTKFEEIGIPNDGIRSTLGANFMSYGELHYTGRPGGYRYFYFGHSTSGAGQTEVPPNWSEGRFGSSGRPPEAERPSSEITRYRGRSTINTIIIMRSFDTDDQCSEIVEALELRDFRI
jgi:hypothetical protein